MEFPSEYFEDEVREGFYISGIIKRSWAAQMEVLSEIDKVCKKHNIKWFADCGTLIGTIRHGGYIPWDDDLDICMLRPDYMRFMEVAQKELPDNYVLLHVYNEGNDYFEHMIRVATGKKLNFDEEYLDKYHECPYAIGIDVFPLDYICDDEKEEEERKKLLKLMMALEENFKEDNSNAHEYDDAVAEVEEICHIKFDRSKNMKEQAYRATDQIFALYSENGGQHVALMPYWINFDNHKYPAKYFDKTIMMPFEMMEMPVPSAYDAVLKIEYGDYMKVYRDGGVHEYPCYEKQENHLIKIAPEYPFKYEFDKADLICEERANYSKPIEQINEMTALIKEAHDTIIATIVMGMYSQVTTLLSACQNSAIQIGTLIENAYGEDNPTIKILEEYCEIIYQINQLVEEAKSTGELGLAPNDILGYLNEIYQAILMGIEENIPNKREVVFIVSKSKDWAAIEKIWEKEKADPNNDVFVIPVPFYDRTATGAPTTEHYEVDMFPEYVGVTDYNSYDLKIRHPDIIYTQDAYDQCNYTNCIMPAYYTKNMKTFTDKLVYIPWFSVDEASANSAKARKAMQYYVTVPGLAHADEVYVQAEAIRKEYIEKLVEFAGEDTRTVWEEKIKVQESVVDDRKTQAEILAKKKAFDELPDDWKAQLSDSNGNTKKIILYNTTIAAYSQYGEDVLDKAEKNFAIFKEYSDKISVIWRPHPQLRAMMANSSSRLVHKYDRIVREFKQMEIGVYDIEKRLEDVLPVCDAYYGDAGGVAHKCEVMGLPVMLQNVELINK